MERDNKKEQVDSTPSMKQTFAVMGILVCLAVAFIALSGIEDSRVSRVSNITLTEDANVVCGINQVTMGEYITFDSCYAYVPEEEIESWDISLVLRAVDSSEGIMIPTYMSDSVVDFKTYQSVQRDFDRTSFGANVACSKLSLKYTEYDILLYYNNNDRDMYVDTGRNLTEEGLQ